MTAATMFRASDLPARIGRGVSRRFVTLASRMRPTTPVFVWGCHRSGTTMLLHLLNRSPWCTVYHESNDRAMREGSRLRDLSTIQGIVRDEQAAFAVFKPLNDAQHARKQLSLQRRAKGVWLYRNPRDVVNSIVTMWGDHQKMAYQRIAGITPVGEADPTAVDQSAAMLREGMSEDTLRHVEKIARPGMTAEDGAALHWYCRNRLYFEQGLDAHPRVGLFRYRDLVVDPDSNLRRVFDFVGCGFRSQWADDVFSSSVQKQSPPPLSSPVVELCDSLLADLDTTLEGAGGSDLRTQGAGGGF
jgi:hypothetical protein